MIPTIDFQRRSTTGPVGKADDFDLELAFKVRELVEKHNIKYDSANLIVDDRTADAIFHAGVELLAEVGLFHQQSSRIMQYNTEELYQLAAESKATPACINLGKGKDRMQLRHRKSADTWAPTNYGGASGVADASWFVQFVQATAQESHVKGIGICPGIPRLGELAPKAGTLTEVEIALWEQEALREGLKRAGRLDMNLGLLCTASTPSGTMAVMASGYRHALNTQIGVHIMPELKMSWNPLLHAQYCELTGIEPWMSSMSCIGGLCRDAAEVAVTMVANGLGQLSYAKGGSMSYFASHLDGSFGTRASQWAFSGASRASERHLGLAVGTAIASGLANARCTPLALYQSASTVVTNVASGLSYAWVTGNSGLESRLIGEMMDVCAGMPAKEANELAQRIMLKIDELLPNAPKTPSEKLIFPDVYDIETVQPKPEYEANMLRVRDDLQKMGMPYR